MSREGLTPLEQMASDTIKLVIEIPKRDYEEIKKVGVFTFPHVSTAIIEATTLDDVKEEIYKAYEAYGGYEPNALGSFEDDVMDILDNVGKRGGKA